MNRDRFDVIGFDADDTLWHSEDGFQAAELRFVDLVAPYAPEGIDVRAALTAVERKNLHVLGYGVKAFGLSAVEAALSITDGAVPTEVIAQILEGVRHQLTEPVRLLPHVPEVLARLRDAGHRLVLITKGDLIHQTHKVETSGLAHHFEHVDILLEKHPEAYAKVLHRIGVDPSRFCMVGNSIRSDILPVMALGGTGVHVPYPLLWELEHVETEDHLAPHLAHHFVELGSITDLPEWLGPTGA
ncbi:MAG: HAD family hydrolase [Ilumatobacteraceae bacterium]